MEVLVIGAGLAGTEAAWQIAQHGIKVRLVEMRPERQTPAHHTSECAELVCSNSFGSHDATRSTGLLHHELLAFDSIVMKVARETKVPAGSALAVDRSIFGKRLTELLSSHPLITFERREQFCLPKDSQICVVATGPLTSDTLAQDIKAFIGEQYLSFFDAASPIVTGESIDYDIAFRASRYNKEFTDSSDSQEASYLNCPFTKEEYYSFIDAVQNAELAPVKDFERDKAKFFEACLPVEELVARGTETLRFGPLKPIGLRDSRKPDERFYAVAQLRMEDSKGRLWNLVGFQTGLKWKDQERILRLIPGLASAEFVRFGVMHRNTYLKSPLVLHPTLQSKNRHTLFFAGQITGTEGYTSAVLGGLLAGINASRLAKNIEPLILPPETMGGALIKYVCEANLKTFQPMPPNFALLPELEEKIKDKRLRHQALSERALKSLSNIIDSNKIKENSLKEVANL
jgi:methylenetetrahydrofolate--tRNA-(uracil-5-)-methyltransferase